MALKIIASISQRVSGPIEVGEIGDQHHIGVDEDGHAINAGHLSYNTYFRRNLFDDGPFNFDGQWEGGDVGPNLMLVHLEFDNSDVHPFLDRFAVGKWRWHSYCQGETVPPKGPPTSTLLSGGGFSGGPPGGGTGGPPGGGFGGGGGSPPPPPPAQPLPIFTYQPFTKGDPVKAFTAMSLETAASAFLGRPQFVRNGELDFRNLRDPSRGELDARNRITPIVARLEAYGEQTSSGWVYADKPQSGERYWGGHTPGGFVLFPPQVGMEDSSTNFEPPSRNVCATFLVMAPKVRLAFGKPDTATGLIKTGMGMAQLNTNLINTYDKLGIAAAGDLGIFSYDSSGTEALRFLMGNVTSDFAWKGSSSSSWGRITQANTANRTYTFPNKDGTVAMLSDIIAGSGTANVLPKWATSTTLGDSAVADAGTTLQVGSGLNQLQYQYSSTNSNLILTDSAGSNKMQLGAATGASTFREGAAGGIHLTYDDSTGILSLFKSGGSTATVLLDGTAGKVTLKDVSNTTWFDTSSTNYELILSDASANASASGRLRRNGAELTWHDGTVATNLLRASIATAKGDILAATASNAVARLGVGSNTTVLTADSTQATGMKWAAVGASAAQNVFSRMQFI